jgi:acylphosphatase
MTGGHARVRQRVVVRGRVQGVAFRAATRSKAEACGVSGWVRNRPDGSVEAAFEGDADAVALVVAFCRTGPRFARVEQVEVFDEALEGLSRFELRI